MAKRNRYIGYILEENKQRVELGTKYDTKNTSAESKNLGVDSRVDAERAKEASGPHYIFKAISPRFFHSRYTVLAVAALVAS